MGTVKKLESVKDTGTRLPVQLSDITDNSKVIKLDSGWRGRLAAVDRMDLEELENVFYAAARNGGAFEAVCKYFGIQRLGSAMTVPTVHRVEALKRAFEAGQADLQLEFRAVTINEALTKKNPLMLIWGGKQFAGFSDAGQVDMAASEDGTGSIGGLFTSIKAQRNEDGTTIGPTLEHKIIEADVQGTETTKD